MYDTRILSKWELRINDKPLEPLTVDLTDPFTAVFVGRAHPPDGRADSDIVSFRERSIGQGMRERITVHNYGADPVDVTIELRGDVDFADLFEVKESRVHHHGGPPCETVDHGLRFTHDAGPVHKAVEIRTADVPALTPNTMHWSMTLAPQEKWVVVHRGDRHPGRRSARAAVPLQTARHQGGAPATLARVVARRRCRTCTATTPASPPPSTRRAKTSVPCASSTPTTPTCRSSPRARRGS